MIDFQTSERVRDAAKPYEHFDQISVYLTHEATLVISLSDVRLIDTQRVYPDPFGVSLLTSGPIPSALSTQMLGKKSRLCEYATMRVKSCSSLPAFTCSRECIWTSGTGHRPTHTRVHCMEEQC